MYHPEGVPLIYPLRDASEHTELMSGGYLVHGVFVKIPNTFLHPLIIGLKLLF